MQIHCLARLHDAINGFHSEIARQLSVSDVPCERDGRAKSGDCLVNLHMNFRDTFSNVVAKAKEERLARSRRTGKVTEVGLLDQRWLGISTLIFRVVTACPFQPKNEHED